MSGKRVQDARRLFVMVMSILLVFSSCPVAAFAEAEGLGSDESAEISAMEDEVLVNDSEGLVSSTEGEGSEADDQSGEEGELIVDSTGDEQSATDDEQIAEEAGDDTELEADVVPDESLSTQKTYKSVVKEVTITEALAPGGTIEVSGTTISDTDATRYSFTLDHKTEVQLDLYWDPSEKPSGMLQLWKLNEGKGQTICYDFNIVPITYSEGHCQTSATLYKGTNVFTLVGTTGIKYTAKLTDKSVYATSINCDDVSTNVGYTVALNATVNPSEVSYSAITYASEDEGIATVNEKGIVTGVSVGTTTIAVQDCGGAAKSVKVTVNPAPLEAINDDNQATIQIGKPAYGVLDGFNYILYTFDLAHDMRVGLNLEWYGENELLYGNNIVEPIIEVYDYDIDAKKLYDYKSILKKEARTGTFASTKNLKQGKHTVLIRGYKRAHFVLKLTDTSTYIAGISASNITTYVGQIATVKPTYKPANGVTAQPSCTSMNPAVAAVTSGCSVKGVKPGKANIVVKDTITGKQTVITATVLAAHISRVGKAKRTLKVGDGVRLGVQSPARFPLIDWKSSNNAVASIDAGGYVTAKAFGIAKITATSRYGNSVSWTIHVNKKKIYGFVGQSFSYKSIAKTIRGYKKAKVSSKRRTIAKKQKNKIKLGVAGRTSVTIKASGKKYVLTAEVHNKKDMLMNAEAYLRRILKHPASLTINNTYYYTVSWGCVLSVDYSAMNGFGGYGREYMTFVFHDGIYEIV